MLGTLLIVALIAVAVGVLFAIGTVVLQGYLYSQPVEGIAWRSATAGAIVGLFFAFWCYLEANWPGRFDTLLNFSPRDVRVFDQFWSEKSSDRGKQEILYRRGKDSRGRIRYLGPEGQIWQRSDDGMMTAIIVEEDGEKKRFEPEMEKGRFKVAENQPLRYVEKGGKGRVMTDDTIGEIVTTRWGLLLGNLLLNFVHFLVWFGVLWLLMRFQWLHAFGLALALWAAFGFAVWPILQARIRAAATDQKPAVQTAADMRTSYCGLMRTWKTSPYSPSSGRSCKPA